MRLVGRGGGLRLGLPPEAFEAWVGERFRDLGYAVEVTPFQGDHGVDLVLTRADETVIVQCKHRPRGSVGEPVLRDLFGALHHFGADRAFLVTTGHLTRTARGWLAGKPIEAWDAARLKEQWGVEVARLAEQAVTQPVSPHGAPPSPASGGRPRMAWYVYTDDWNRRWAVELPRSIGGQPALGFEPLADPTIAPLPRTLRMRYVSLKSRESRPRYLRRIPFGSPHKPADVYRDGLVFVGTTGRRTTWDIRLDSVELWDRGVQPAMPNGERPMRWVPSGALAPPVLAMEERGNPPPTPG